MEFNGFYYGVLCANGYRSSLCEPCFNSKKTVLVDCPSSAVKQAVFDCIKAELKRQSIAYTDFCVADGSGGIYCPNFKIVDADICCHGAENETVFSLDDFADRALIRKNKKEIDENIVQRNKQLLRAKRFLSACESINDDLARLTEPYINKTKINKFTYNLWQRISNGMKGHIGTQAKRYVTCLTADGSELDLSAFDAYCKKMLVVKDRTGVCAALIADRLRRYALGSGYDVIVCPCTVNENVIEHIIIPELEFGLFTSKYYHRDDFENSRIIFAKRFLYSSVESIKNRTDFSVRTYRSLMNEVFASLTKIKECDKEIDKIYLEATDVDKLKKEAITLCFK